MPAAIIVGIPTWGTFYQLLKKYFKRSTQQSESMNQMHTMPIKYRNFRPSIAHNLYLFPSDNFGLSVSLLWFCNFVILKTHLKPEESGWYTAAVKD